MLEEAEPLIKAAAKELRLAGGLQAPSGIEGKIDFEIAVLAEEAGDIYIRLRDMAVRIGLELGRRSSGMSASDSESAGSTEAVERVAASTKNFVEAIAQIRQPADYAAGPGDDRHRGDQRHRLRQAGRRLSRRRA